MHKKFIYILIIIISLLFLFGCKNDFAKNKKIINEKDLKATSCKELLTLINIWEKEGNININYSFKKDNKGIYTLNKTINDFTYTINDTNLIINEIDFYSLSCDLNHNTITLSNENSISTFVIKGTQIFKDLVGTKNSEIKGIWTSKKETITLLEKNNSSFGKYNEGRYEITSLIDYITPSKNILIIQTLSNGKEREYTYEIINDELKLYYDKKLVDNYVKEK